MEKLEQIEDALKSRDDIISIQEEYFYEPKLFESRYEIPTTAMFLVAPKTGIYDLKELQQFMLGFASKVIPQHVGKFHKGKDQFGKKAICLGTLLYWEKIATRTITEHISITGSIMEKMVEVDGVKEDTPFISRMHSQSRPIERRISILVAPDKSIGDYICHSNTSIYCHDRYVTKKELKKHIPNGRKLAKQLFSR